MKRQANFAFGVLIASLVVSCTGKAIAPVDAKTTAEAYIQPGDTVGEIAFVIARDETGEPSIFNYCNPIITDTDPAVVVRTCNLPQMSYIFIGYGELASTSEELDSIWNNETWKLYFDGTAVNLTAFGYFDVTWEGNQLRQWQIAIENLTPGEHRLRYVVTKVDNSREPTDATWVFTVGDKSSTSTPLVTGEGISYPTLSSTVAKGQTPYSSRNAKLNFLLYVPDDYGKDPQLKWPLILYLHGGLSAQGINLDNLRIGSLPQKLESEANFPFLVLSPEGRGEYEFWPKDEMVKSLFVLIEEIQSYYSIDPQRIYLTGVSVGAEGVWEIGLRYPERFSALIPVMGYYGYPFEVPANICDLKDVPIWAFHGAKDETVPLDAEEGLVNALKACGGNVQLTIFPNAGHDIAYEVYANSDLYTWMLSQALK